MRRIAAVVVLAAAGYGALALSGTASRDTATALVNHFQCYRVDPGLSPVKGIALTTQFGTVKASPSHWSTLCAPVRKNGSAVVNARAHLACYPIKASPAFRPRTVFVTNQFQKDAGLVVVAPTTACLPSGKSIQPAPPPGLVKGLDTYECYSVKPRSTAQVAPVTLVDQFGKSRAKIGLAVALCAPAKLNSLQVFDRVTHLVCYAITALPAFLPRHVTIRNAFGVGNGTVFQRQTLCLPSTKRLG